MRPGRGLVFGVGGFDRRADPTCQTDLCRQTLLVTPMPYSTIQKGNGGALARVRVRTLSRWKEGKKEEKGLRGHLITTVCGRAGRWPEGHDVTPKPGRKKRKARGYRTLQKHGATVARKRGGLAARLVRERERERGRTAPAPSPEQSKAKRERERELGERTFPEHPCFQHSCYMLAPNTHISGRRSQTPK